MKLTPNGLDFSVILLTKNEALHLDRCLSSLRKVTDNIFVVDSFSNDNTLLICANHKAKVVQREWKNYSDQFQWAMINTPFKSEWQFRIDADEYLDDELIHALKNLVPNDEISGYYIRRKLIFKGKWIKFGGYYPVRLLRLYKTVHASLESRNMDEHIIVHTGAIKNLPGNVIDENLNNIDWWTQKHMNYAVREMADHLTKFEDEKILSGNLFSLEKPRRV